VVDERGSVYNKFEMRWRRLA